MNIQKIVQSVLFLVVVYFIAVSPQQARANDTEGLTSSYAERVDSFVANIAINKDNSINVTERIEYYSGNMERHGIYRDIYPYSSGKQRKMNIDNVSVVDESNNPYIFEVSDEKGKVHIKIGNPDVTFSGNKTYIIRYRATAAIDHLDAVDELYWNVTGNEWLFPIRFASASITLPSGAVFAQKACYVGAIGSTASCVSQKDTFFETAKPLESKEGLTVAVGFSKGVMEEYSLFERMMQGIKIYGRWVLVFGLPILTLVFSLRYWYMRGRDERETRVIIPQYDVLDNLTPMEVAGIALEKVSVSHLSGEIIYLATKGYLEIHQKETKTLGLFTSLDYELVQLQYNTDTLREADKKLLESLFRGEKTVVVSELKNVFYKNVQGIVNATLDNLKQNGYYKNLGRMKYGAARMILVLFFSVWAAGAIGLFLGTLLFDGNPVPMMLSIFISIITYGIVSYFDPAKTEKGVAAKEYLLGLKDYLQIAEKNRLEFHNAPEKKPEVFEALLPYAMVLGVADIWAKEFEDMYVAPPSWYSGSSQSNAFNASIFAQSLSDFSSFSSSALTSSPGGGSGSGGGGSSGGGGGGGGGGSW